MYSKDSISVGFNRTPIGYLNRNDFFDVVVGKELCDCGHINVEHGDTGIVYGHGPCLYKMCDCEQFTWAKFL